MIFRKFERARRVRNMPRTRSSGLGLAFCKLVVDAHGGRIWVQSAAKAKGSAFHFSLPTQADSTEVRVTAGRRRAARERVCAPSGVAPTTTTRKPFAR